MNRNDELILEMIEDIKNYQLEIIALRAYIFKDRPDLKYELLSDLTPHFIYNETYIKLIKRFKDPFEDEKFINEIQKIEEYGYSYKHPFSI